MNDQSHLIKKINNYFLFGFPKRGMGKYSDKIITIISISRVTISKSRFFFSSVIKIGKDNKPIYMTLKPVQHKAIFV